MRDEIATADDLTGELRAAVTDLLYRLGDDELVIGHRNSEWTGLGPILEADIAFSSMAQDEIGHAVAYYGLLQELGEPDPDAIAFRRGPAQFRCCNFVALGSSRFEGARDASWADRAAAGRAAEPDTPDTDAAPSRVGGDWAFSLVRQYLYDSAESLRLAAFSDGAYRPLAALARKLAREEKYHLMHGKSWIARLGTGTPDSHARIQSALSAAMPHALAIFEPTRWSDLLARRRICPAEESLRDAWLAAIRPDLSAAGLEIDPLPEPLFGGRRGEHLPEFTQFLDGLTKVNRLEPEAAW